MCDERTEFNELLIALDNLMDVCVFNNRLGWDRVVGEASVLLKKYEQQLQRARALLKKEEPNV